MLKKKLGIECIEIDRNIRINLRHYYKIPSSLIIPDGVEVIGYRAFCDCKVEKVVISGSVKKIRACAFVGCRKLKKVIIPENIEEIGSCAFSGCGKAEVIIEKTKEDFEIGEYAFFECKSVKYVKEKTRN